MVVDKIFPGDTDVERIPVFEAMAELVKSLFWN